MRGRTAWREHDPVAWEQVATIGVTAVLAVSVVYNSRRFDGVNRRFDDVDRRIGDLPG